MDFYIFTFNSQYVSGFHVPCFIIIITIIFYFSIILFLFIFKVRERTITIIQVAAMILTKKKTISSISNLKNLPWNLVECYGKFFIVNVSKVTCENVVIFLKLWIVGKTKNIWSICQDPMCLLQHKSTIYRFS